MKEENFKFLIKLNINEEGDSILIFRYMRSFCRRFFFHIISFFLQLIFILRFSVQFSLN